MSGGPAQGMPGCRAGLPSREPWRQGTGCRHAESQGRERITTVLFASCGDNHISPDFVSSRSTCQSCLSKGLEKQVSASLSLSTTYGIRLSWALMITNHSAHCCYIRVSQLGALGSPFHFQDGKDSQREFQSPSHSTSLWLAV